MFATRDITKGEIILHWNLNNQIDSQEYDTLSERERRYISLLESKYILMQEPEKYMNHSCDPNTYVEDFSDVALRNICSGEELTSDYSSYSLEPIMKCNCGSQKCKWN